MSHQGRAFKEPASQSATRAPSAAAPASRVRATGPIRQGITLPTADSDDLEELREVVASLLCVRLDLECRELRARRGEPLSPFQPPAMASINAIRPGGLGNDDDEEDGIGAGGGTGGAGDGQAFSTILFWIEDKFRTQHDRELLAQFSVNAGRVRFELIKVQ